MNTERPNILLISVDCLRSDHVGCYGYGKGTTPNIDSLAGNGVLYKNCIATSCWTLPCMASMMTGLFPSRHGAHDEHQYLAADRETLATMLHGNGYQTASIVTVPWLTDAFGMARGLDRLIDLKESKWVRRLDRLKTLRNFRCFNRARYNYSVRCRDAAHVSDAFQRLLNKRSGKPFYFHCHYFDCHPPFLAPSEFLQRFCTQPVDAIEFNLEFRTIFRRFMRGEKDALTDEIRRMYVELYDATIAYVDQQIGEQIQALRNAGHLEDTAIIVAADHGILFGEHGLLDHNFNLYNSVLSVPLVVHYPPLSSSSQEVSGPVQHTDIVPSILELCKVSHAGEFQGNSLLEVNGALEPNATANGRYAFSELYVNKKRQKSYGLVTEKRVKAIQNSQYKYIHSSTGDRELYDLLEDPGETANIAKDRSRLANQLGEKALRHQSSFFDGSPTTDGSEYANMNSEVENRLKALGYL